MHYKLEAIFPPQFTNIDNAVSELMKPFSENLPADSEISLGRPFWNWFQIGGRYSGSKLQAKCDPEKLEQFYQELTSRKVTVSGLQWGKQELSPASQIPMVDALWAEMFPDIGAPCTLFQHSTPNNNGTLPLDVCTVADLPASYTAYAVLIGAPNSEGKLEPVYLIQQSTWNGVNHIDADWTGKVMDAIGKHHERLAHYRDEYKARTTVGPDWRAVTVDYHS